MQISCPHGKHFREILLSLPIIICALLGIFLVEVCVATEVTALGWQDNGKEIQMKAGDFIELSLEEHAGTGYIWEFHCLDTKHLQLSHSETRPLDGQPRLGGPVLKVWQLKALEPGLARLSLYYLRPWEGLAQAAKHFEVQIRIQ